MFFSHVFKSSTENPSSWNIWATPTKLRRGWAPLLLGIRSNQGLWFYGAALLLEYLGNANQAAPTLPGESSNQGFRFYGAALLLEYLANANPAAKKGDASAAWNPNQGFVFFTAAFSSWNIQARPSKLQRRWCLCCVDSAPANDSSWHICCRGGGVSAAWKV